MTWINGWWREVHAWLKKETGIKMSKWYTWSNAAIYCTIVLDIVALLILSTEPHVMSWRHNWLDLTSCSRSRKCIYKKLCSIQPILPRIHLTGHATTWWSVYFMYRIYVYIYRLIDLDWKWCKYLAQNFVGTAAGHERLHLYFVDGHSINQSSRYLMNAIWQHC